MISIQRNQSKARRCRVNMGSVYWEYRFLIVFLSLVVVYFLSMDVVLYLSIQSLTVNIPTVNDTSPADTHYYFSPFNDLHIKKMMINPFSQYFTEPVSSIFNEVTGFSSEVYFITPNAISLFHSLVALIAARFVMSQSLTKRQLGVFLFHVRTLLDSLDGVVARARMSSIEKKLGEFWSTGHIIDGVCDIAGTIFVFIGCTIFLMSHPSRKQYTVLPITRDKERGGGSPVSDKLRSQKSPIILMVCYGALVFVNSCSWNYYMDKYSEMVDIHANTTQQQRVLQLIVLKSPSMWIITWLWRVLNAPSLIQYMLISILFDKISDYINWVQYIGYLVLALLICCTQIHYLQTVNFMNLSHTTWNNS